MRKAEIDAGLKQEVIRQGMSVTDIERIIQASRKDGRGRTTAPPPAESQANSPA